MFSVGTYHSLVAHLVRLVTARNEVSQRPSRVRPSTDQGFGCCPLCGEFVAVTFPLDDAEAARCPRCGGAIDGVEPLGGDPS